MITIARVKRNGAKNRMQMAREFLDQASEQFKNYRISEVIETLRSYEREGLFIITDTELILNHII